MSTRKTLLLNPPAGRRVMTTPAGPITWDRLVAIEPRLGDLLREAKTIYREHRRAGKRVDDLAVWYGYGGWPGLKRKLIKLVGWDAEYGDEYPELCSCDAYDLTYRKIYNALLSPRPRGRW